MASDDKPLPPLLGDQPLLAAGSSFADQVTQAMDRLREQYARMEEVRQELAAATASATSKDRMVTANVGPQGQVVSLTFHTNGYREMAPAQLGTLLTDVLNEARAKIGDQVIASIRGFEGLGQVLGSAMPDGAPDLDELLKPLRSMRPGFAEEEARANRKRQEEFRG